MNNTNSQILSIYEKGVNNLIIRKFSDYLGENIAHNVGVLKTCHENIVTYC